MESPKEELDIISYLSNPIVRSNVRSIAGKFQPVSDLGKTLLIYYLSLSTSYIPEDGAMEAHIKSKGYIDNECGFAIAKKCSYCNIKQEGANELIKAFFSYYNKQKILDAVKQYQKNEIIDQQKAQKELLDTLSNINSTRGSLFEMTTINEDNIYEILDAHLEGGESLIPSKFSVVRKSSMYNAYAKGWIITVAAPPSAGKTLFMLNEVINMAKHGFNTVWIALGDMTEASLTLRIISIVTGVDKEIVCADYKKYVNKEVLEVLSHIKIVVYSANEITANECVNNVLSIDPLEFDYQIVVFDYDDNFSTEFSDNMYKDGGNTYKEYTRIAKKKDDYKLVFSGSQVKQELWDIECLPERCLSQSSAKQPVIDMLIGINKNIKNRKVGTINISKQRNGDEAKSNFKIEENGNFRSLQDAEYQSMVR